MYGCFVKSTLGGNAAFGRPHEMCRLLAITRTSAQGLGTSRWGRGQVTLSGACLDRRGLVLTSKSVFFKGAIARLTAHNRRFQTLKGVIKKQF